MSESENSKFNNKNKVLSAEELNALLKNPPSEFIQEAYGLTSIIINGYTIEDEQLILDDSIKVDLPLTFHGCTIKSENFLFISGLTCNESLTFEDCIVSDCIFFHSGNFKDVIIKNVQVKSIHLSGCTFNKVSISAYGIDEILVSGAKFESLHIGEYLSGDDVGKLVIFAKEDETGDIIVNEQRKKNQFRQYKM